MSIFSEIAEERALKVVTEALNTAHVKLRLAQDNKKIDFSIAEAILLEALEYCQARI